MSFFDDVVSFFQQALGVISSFRFADVLDICLVAFVVYSIVKLVRETRAIQLFKGLILFAFIYVVITLLDMQASLYLFNSVASNAIICLIIVFAPEIRHALESVGRSSFSTIGLFNFDKNAKKVQDERINNMITEVCRSVSTMSEKKIGVLLVFEQKTLLGSIIETGTKVDAVITEELLGTIFFPKTPLHDGAAIVKGDRIAAAGCILPLTKNNALSKELGTRHRAAIGMSEESDAIILVVSEETGKISLVSNGKINRDISSGELREQLQNYLITKDNETKVKITDKVSGLFKSKK